MNTKINNAGVGRHEVLRQRPSFVDWVTRTVPTLLVMGALAGLGYFGHLYDWG